MTSENCALLEVQYRETPKVNSKGDFPPEFRAEHKTAPLKVNECFQECERKKRPSLLSRPPLFDQNHTNGFMQRDSEMEPLFSLPC
eukprot:559229-Pelagomonas_calceolata.AAC.4